jgi:ligand-binding sensor domain-containing protein
LPERRPFGLPGDQVGALYAAPGGVWALTERGLTSTAGLTFVASDLSRFDWRLGDPVFGQPFRSVRQLIAADTLLWAATDGGALGFPIAGGQAYRLTVQDGLPDDRVFAVAANKGRVFFGTWSGLGELADSAGRFVVHRIAPAFADQALALAVAGDTLWVGTPRGLYARVPGESDLLQAPGWGSSVRFRTPVLALRWQGDTLLALTSDELLWRDPATGGWVEGPALSGAIGPLRVMAGGANGLWVGGTRGVGFVRPGGPVLRPLLSGSALPGSVADVAVDQDDLWVATDRGLVRFALDAVRP